MLPHASTDGTGFWRALCQNLDDADLAGELRERLRWRDDQHQQLPDWVRNWAHDGNPDAAWYVHYWDSGVSWAFEAITLPLIEEAIRRLSRNNQRQTSRMSIEQLLTSYGDRLRSAGEGRWRTRCPWHDDNQPSLVVFERGWCHCFGCGAHHPVSDLAAAWKGQAA